MEKIKINTDYIKLDQLLKWSGVVGSGSDAKYLISERLVKVNDEITIQRGKKISKGDIIEIDFQKGITFMVE